MTKNNIKVVAYVFFFSFIFIVFSFGQSVGGDAQEVTRGFDNLISWVARVLGGVMLAFGIIWTGIMMANHDENALKKGVGVMIGGVLIFAAPKIVKMIQAWVG